MRAISRSIATLALGALVFGSPAVAQSPSASTTAAFSDRFGLPADADLSRNAQIPVVDLPADPSDLAGPVDPNPALATLTSRSASFPPEAWDIKALAATFDGDPERAFQFVRDSIGFDPYRGVLRGAAGTLIARAGSAADRSLLLAALLVAMCSSSRF